MPRSRKPSLRSIGVVVLSGALLSACSDDSTQRCVESAGGTVCAEAVPGGLEISAAGLKPGTVVSLNTAGIGTSEYAVSDDGGIDGSVGVLTASGDFVGVIGVAATAADETPLTGNISFS